MTQPEYERRVNEVVNSTTPAVRTAAEEIGWLGQWGFMAEFDLDRGDR